MLALHAGPSGAVLAGRRARLWVASESGLAWARKLHHSKRLTRPLPGPGEAVFAEQPQQALGVKGLGEVVVEAGPEALPPVLLRAARRDRHQPVLRRLAGPLPVQAAPSLLVLAGSRVLLASVKAPADGHGPRHRLPAGQRPGGPVVAGIPAPEPIITPRKKTISSPFAVRPVDRRGPIRFRWLGPSLWLCSTCSVILLPEYGRRRPGTDRR